MILSPCESSRRSVPRLRHAVLELAVAQIAIRRDGDLVRPGHLRLRRVLPIDGEPPRIHAVVFENVLQLRAPGGHHDVGRARRRHRRAVDVGVVEKADAVEHDALFARRLAFEHLCTIDDARVLLDDVVASARRHVVAVAPDCRPRVVGEERTKELVAEVRAHRIVARADRVAHRIGARWTLSAASRLASTALPGRRRMRRRGRRRLEEGASLPRAAQASLAG